MRNPSTPGPTSSIQPEFSWPRMKPGWSAGRTRREVPIDPDVGVTRARSSDSKEHFTVARDRTGHLLEGRKRLELLEKDRSHILASCFQRSRWISPIQWKSTHVLTVDTRWSPQGGTKVTTSEVNHRRFTARLESSSRRLHRW